MMGGGKKRDGRYKGRRLQGRGGRRGGARRREGFQGEEVVFGSNGRTRSVTRRVYPRECERRSLARSLAPLAVLR